MMKYYEFVNHNIDNLTSSIMIKKKKKTLKTMVRKLNEIKY